MPVPLAKEKLSVPMSLNIYEEGELQPEATVKKFLTVRREGTRDVSRKVEYYNLDAVISLGYRRGA